MLALDPQKHLVHVPLVPRLGTAATELIGILLAELAAPFPNRFVGHAHAAFEQYFLHIAEAYTEPEVQPHRMANDFDREPVIRIFDGGGQCVHAATFPCNRGARQVDNAPGADRALRLTLPSFELAEPALKTGGADAGVIAGHEGIVVQCSAEIPCTFVGNHWACIVSCAQEASDEFIH